MEKTDKIYEPADGLERRLSLFDSTMMIVGIVIGSGIFLLSGIMANSLPSGGFILLAWAVGGLLALAGALTFAELGAAMPQAGGQYVYLREAYGQLAGFLFGWMLCFVSIGGGLAATAVGFAEYLSFFFPILSLKNNIISIPIFSYVYTISMGQLVALSLVLLLSAINYVGVGLGKIFQNIVTVIKIGAIVVFIILGFVIRNPTHADLSISLSESGFGFGQLLIGFGVALIAVSWAFDGWNNLNYVAGEIKKLVIDVPKRLTPAQKEDTMKVEERVEMGKQ